MPELPEVETTVAGLRAVLDGQTIVRAEPRRRRPSLADACRFAAAADRRAGHGFGAGAPNMALFHTDRDDVLIFHLGMSGRWRVDPVEIEKHDHFIMETGGGRIVALNDHRRFGSLDILPAAEMDRYKPFVTMGPEPLSDDFDAGALQSALKGRAASIKSMLLNQDIVAGLGNIYVCEALHMAGIAPTAVSAKIGKARLEKLVVAIKDVLTSAIAAGGSTLRDFAALMANLAILPRIFWSMGGKTNLAIAAQLLNGRVDSGRSTFYCAKCQR